MESEIRENVFHGEDDPLNDIAIAKALEIHLSNQKDK